MKKIIFGIALLLLFGAGCIDLSIDGACKEMESRALQYIPVRCYKELGIQKGCFNITEKWIQTGKTGHYEYSVAPLCDYTEKK